MTKPVVSLVVAKDESNVIGIDGGLPWHLSADLKYFRRITMGKPVIMGRKTHESIGRPLPGRENIVITRRRDYRAEGCVVVDSIEAALEHASEAEELMIIGGASLYRDMLPLARRIYLTQVHAEVEGDTWFPDFNSDEWVVAERSSFPADESNDHPYSFIVLERVGGF